MKEVSFATRVAFTLMCREVMEDIDFLKKGEFTPDRVKSPLERGDDKVVQYILAQYKKDLLNHEEFFKNKTYIDGIGKNKEDIKDIYKQLVSFKNDIFECNFFDSFNDKWQKNENNCRWAQGIMSEIDRESEREAEMETDEYERD